MKIKWERLANIKSAELEIDDFTVIVGDNSLGKTILLEAYSLFTNFLKDQQKDFMKDGFIKEIIITNEEDLKFVDFFDFEDSENEIELLINYDISDENEISAIINDYKVRYLKLLQDNILGEEKDSFKVELIVSEVSKEFILPTEVYVRTTTNGNYNVVLKRNDGSSRRINFPKNLAENHIAFVGHIKNRIKYFLNLVFFIEIFNLKDIVFFPSERNLYKSNALRKTGNFIEETFSQEEVDSDMRYSESLFLKSYLDFIDYQDFSSQNRSTKNAKGNIQLYELICKFLGGEPVYEDGVVTKIRTEEGEEISSKLFSTKQSRLLPYIMLSSPIFRRNRLVIIEEPEAHMSLKSMFELVKLTENILRDHKLIITSHSDVFVTLLNNMIKKNNIETNVYELLDTNEGAVLNKVNRGKFGYELSFMADQIIKLNEETIEVFKDEINENE